LYLAVDYWLLSEFERNLDLLTPVDDEAMRNVCPCWDALVESMKAWAQTNKATLDLRYFSLWPRIVEALGHWDAFVEEERIKLVNSAFALSSIAGDRWFVEEAERLCAAIKPYFEGLTVVRKEREESDENPSEQELSNSIAQGAEPEASEREESMDTSAREREDAPHHDAHGNTNSTSGGQLPVTGSWDELGEQLEKVGARLRREGAAEDVLEELSSIVTVFERLRSSRNATAQIREETGSQVEALARWLSDLATRPAFLWVAAYSDRAATVLREWVSAAGAVEQIREIAGQIERIDGQLKQAAEEIERVAVEREAFEKRREALQTEMRAAKTHAQRTTLQQQQRALPVEEQELNARLEKYEALLIASLELGEVEAANAIEAEDQSEPPVISGAGPVAVATSADSTPEPVSTTADSGQSAGEPESQAPVEMVEATDEPVVGPAAETIAPEPVQIGPVDVEPAIEVEDAKPSTPPHKELIDEEFSDEAGEACRPIWQSLRRGRPGAAYFIAIALRERQPDLRVPSPDLIRAVALSRQLKSPDGEIARELGRAFGELDPETFGGGPEAWKVANNLLLVAACLRALLLAPDTGAAGAAAYVHLGEEYGSLYRLRTLLADYGERLRASRLDAGAFRSAASAGDWQAAMTRLAGEASDWRQKAPNMTTKYQAATSVWRHWLKPGNGLIWRMLDPVTTGNLEQVEQTRSLVELLADYERREAEITRTDRKELRRQKGQDIDFGALQQLHSKADAAVQLAQRWLSLANARPGHGDYVSRELANLQRTALPLIERVLGEIQAANGEDDWRLVASARRCVREAVQSIGQLFTPGVPSDEAEWPAPKAIGIDLLLAYPVPLGDQWSWEGGAEGLLEVVHAQGTAEPDWVGLARARLECGDICNALRILESMGSAREAEELRREVNRVAVHLQSTLKQQLNKSLEAVELAFAYRIIGEEERANASAMIADLERVVAESSRFDRAREALELLEREIAAKKEQRMAGVAEVADRVRQARPDADFSKVQECIDVGDLASAHEWLQRIESGFSEEDELTERDAFTEFFPERLRVIDAALTPMRTAEPLIKAVSNGEMFAGLAFGEIPPEGRKSASDLLKAWYGLKTGRGHPLEAIERVLRGMGFAKPQNAQVLGQSGNRLECRFDAEPIADRRICPVPLFGSRAAGKYRLVYLPGTVSEEEILASAGAHVAGRPTIAFFMGRLSEARRRSLAKLARERREPVLVLDENLLVFLCGEKRSRLAAFFHCALPFAHTDPFVTTSSDVPPEMFYGRIDELRAVMAQDGRCLVYGGRQLGKTALLRHAERAFHQPARHHFARWIDLRGEGVGYASEPSEVWMVIWRELQRVGALPDSIMEPKSTVKGRVQSFLDGMKGWFEENTDRRLLLLLDEADRFLALDARNQYQDTVRLKNLMEATSRRFKVVFAGLHNVLRTAEQSNHPLAHLGEPVVIGPLLNHVEWKEAGELLRQPLLATGFQLESRRLVDRVLAQTNYYPSLIQLYGSKLLGQRVRAGLSATDVKSGPRYTISSHHLDETYQQRELRDEIRTKFQLTLQLDPRYEVIAYSVAYVVVVGEGRVEEGTPVSELRRMAHSWWEAGFKQTNEREFATVLDEMVGLGVLRKVSDGKFALRNPNILLLMGSADEIQSILSREREPAEEFESTTWRVPPRTGGETPHRSPLTLSQVADLVRPANGVTVICGCGAASIGDVEKFLREQIDPEFLVTIEETAERVRFGRTLEGIESRRGGGTTVYLVPESVPWTTEWVTDATRKLARLHSKDKHARVVFVADPRTLLTETRAGLEQLGGSVVWMNVRPWHESFVRHWLTDQHALGDPESRSAIAAETGYWPMLLEQWVKLGRSAGTTNGRRATDKLYTQEELERAFGLDLPELAGTLNTMAVVASDPLSIDEILGLEPRERGEVELAIGMASRLSLVTQASGERWRLDPIAAKVLMARDR
jgi:hypothetical protein